MAHALQEQRRTLTGLARVSLVLALGALGLAACATAPQRSSLVTSAEPGPRPAPSPGGQGLHGTDKPYQINGVWYYPHADPNYDVVGYASWYGPAFHNRHTADGEIFDQYALSAAHKTLPLPSIVEVTNLDNGRSIKLRLNDRGPFVGERVLDVSRGAAEKLGFAGKGLARVRVRYVGPAPATPEFSAPVTYAAIGGGMAAASLAPPIRRAAPARASDDADAPMPTISRDPQGTVMAQSLAPAAAPPPASAPVQLAANDTGRFTEASVALGGGAMAPLIQTAPAQPLPSPGTEPGDPIPMGVAPPPQPVAVAALETPPPALAPAAVAPVAASVDGFSVQAGAFSSRDNAERAAAQLGASAAIRPMARGGLTLYRVVLPGYPDAAAAQAARAQAVAAGFADARVVSAY